MFHPLNENHVPTSEIQEANGLRNWYANFQEVECYPCDTNWLPTQPGHLTDSMDVDSGTSDDTASISDLITF